MTENQKRQVITALKNSHQALEAVREILARSGEKTKNLRNAKMGILETIDDLKREEKEIVIEKEVKVKAIGEEKKAKVEKEEDGKEEIIQPTDKG